MSDAFEEALERLRGIGTEVVGGGDPNHGPMAAEAMVKLGRDDIVVTWADRYRQQFAAMPAATSRITDDSWREAMGAIGRIGDWVAFFQAQLAEAHWQAVFQTWIGRLVPGTVSAGAHGLIRTAHAVRALETAQSPLRVEEFGVALAYWSAYYRELPGVPRFAGKLDFGRALAKVPLIMRGSVRRGMPRELILRVADAYPEFSAAVNQAAEPPSVEDALSALTEAGARVYLANADRYPLVLLHAVTVPAALRLLLPHIPGGLRTTALAYVWENVAATVATYGEVGDAGRPEAAPAPQSLIIEEAIESNDPHAIKLTEACLREFRQNPQPVYLAAARDWATRQRRAKGWSDAQRAAAGIAMR